MKPIFIAEVEKHNLPVAFINNHDVCDIAAKFLGVSSSGLDKALCTRTTVTRGETIVSPLSASQARDVCDAFVKGIYGRQFVWIVSKINQVIFKPKVIKQAYLAYFFHILVYPLSSLSAGEVITEASEYWCAGHLWL